MNHKFSVGEIAIAINPRPCWQRYHNSECEVIEQPMGAARWETAYWPSLGRVLVKPNRYIVRFPDGIYLQITERRLRKRDDDSRKVVSWGDCLFNPSKQHA